MLRTTNRTRSLSALALLLATLFIPILFLVHRSEPANLLDSEINEDMLFRPELEAPLPKDALCRLGTTRLRHTTHVRAAAFSPDGKIIATAAEYETIFLWDALTGQLLQTLPFTNRQNIHALAFSPNGEFLAIAGETIQLWRVANWELIFKVKDDDYEDYRFLAFSPDGRELLVGTSGFNVGSKKLPSAANILEVPSGRRISRQMFPKDVLGVNFSPNGPIVATAGKDNSFWLCNASTGRELQRFEKTDYGPDDVAFLPSVAFSPDGKWVASADWGGVLTLWEKKTRTVLWRKDVHSTYVSLSFSPDSSILLIGGYWKTLHLFETVTGKEWAGFRNLEMTGFGTFTADGKRLALWGGDHSVHLWDFSSGRERRIGVGHSDIVQAFAMANDSRTVASVGSDCIRVWDARTGQQFRQFGGRAIRWSLAVSPDGKLVAAGSLHGGVQLWAMSTGRLMWSLSRESSAKEVAFSPDGKLLFTLWGDVIRAWNIETGEKIHEYGEQPKFEEGTFRANRVRPEHLAVSPDGKMVAVNDLHRVRIWDIATGKETEPKVEGTLLRGPIAFTPDSKGLAFAWWKDSEGGLCLWDVAGSKEISRMKLEWATGCSHLAFSPDGRTVAGAYQDSIRVWSVPELKKIIELNEHKGSILKVIFTADGKSLISSGYDTTLLVWDVSKATKR